MRPKKVRAILTLILMLVGTVRSFAVEPSSSLPITNMTRANITVAEVERAYEATLARYRKVLSPMQLARIDRAKITRIAIVERTSRPDLSEAGLTQALVDLDSGEVESIVIEVQPEYRQGTRRINFQTLIEHEFAHALAFMVGLPEAQEIGHSIQIEQLQFPKR